MASKATAEAIAHEVAGELCDEVRADNRGKWWRWQFWMCWGCDRATGDDHTKRCWYDPPQNRGCVQVSTRYDRA